MPKVERLFTGGGALVLSLVVAAVVTVLFRPGTRHPVWPGGGVFQVTPANAHVHEGEELRVQLVQGTELWFSEAPEGPLRPRATTSVLLKALPDRVRAERMSVIPTAAVWSSPAPGLPVARVLRMAAVDDLGRMGPPRMHTLLFEDHGELPVVSLALSEGAMFDPDTGIYVPGNAMLAPPDKQLAIYQEDGRWWKYPGNYSMRGRKWERAGQVQVIAPDGSEEYQGAVGVRVNGNMTRGYPLKALRLLPREPVQVPLFPNGEGRGARSFILRPAGNDMAKAFMRDALANELCAALPFEVARSRPAVLYINGAYWGLHHLQQRIDERELARRHDLRAKEVVVIEAELLSLHGDSAEALRLRDMIAHALKGDTADPRWAVTLEAMLDMDAFFDHMAACMVLGQQDWPKRNVRLWRHTGAPGTGRADGRWRFIMNDMDLSLGAVAGPSADMFTGLSSKRGYPLPDLWRGIMRSGVMRERFARHALALLQGPLSQDAMLPLIDRYAAMIAPEMDRHADRWHKPASTAAWETEVEVIRSFARRRGGHVAEQLARWMADQ